MSSSLPSGLSRSVSGDARRRSLSNSHVADNRIKWIFLLLGMAVLLSWNVMVVATPYFLSNLKGHSLRSTFNSYMSLSYTATNLISLAYTTYTAANADITFRIRRFGFAVAAINVLLAISPVLPLYEKAFFGFVILCGMSQAMCGAFLQSSVVALSAIFGSEALAVMFSGQAVIGVVVSVVQYISTATSSKTASPSDSLLEPDTDLSGFAFIFFGLSGGFMLLAIASHSYLTRLPIYHAIMSPILARKGMVLESEVEEPDAEDLESEPFLRSTNPLNNSIELQAPVEISIKNIAKKNALYNLSVFWVFGVSLSVFPPITSSILSVNTDSASKFLSPILFISLHFLIFNISDWVGRYMCNFPRYLIWSPKVLAGLSFSRVLFIPLFLSCNLVTEAASPSFSASSLIQSASPPPLINSDIIYILILISFGVSNGYVSTMTMMSVSSPQHNSKLKKEEVDATATVAQFFLVGGLAVGSLLSFAVRGWVCGCNPLFS